MRTLNMIDASSAFEHLRSENGRKVQRLGDLQGLCAPRRANGQGWTFRGDWKKRVAPTFFSK